MTRVLTIVAVLAVDGARVLTGGRPIEIELSSGDVDQLVLFTIRGDALAAVNACAAVVPPPPEPAA